MDPTTDDLLADVRAALTAYYDFPVQPIDTVTHPIDTYLNGRHTQHDDARHAVDAACQVLSAREIAQALRLPGHLVVQLISDPVRRGEAWTAEIHHLDRTAALVRRMRGTDVARRVEAGEQKTALAAEYGVSRPTLDEWIRDSREGWESLAPSWLDHRKA